LSSYRTDRVLLPVYLFSIFLLINFLYLFYKRAHRQILKRSVIALAIILILLVVGKTSIFASTLIITKDTRQDLYEYIEKNLPRRSKVFSVHLTIAGGFSVLQKLSKSAKEFKGTVIYVNDKDRAVEALSTLEGYFILSAIDYDILDNFKETKYYSNQWKALEKLIERSDKIAYFEKIGYRLRLFGPLKSSGSFYGIYNPPLSLYRTKDAPTKEVYYRISKIPYKIRREKNREININLNKLLFSILDDNGKIVNFKPSDWETASWGKIKLSDKSSVKSLLVSNDSKTPLYISYQYLGKDEKGKDLAFGFADDSYKGKELLFTTWVKASKPSCVLLGFYKGNISVFSWGEDNLLGEPDKNYELLSYDGVFDSPYSLNGNIRYQVNPACKVELTVPQFFLLEEN